MKTFVFAYDRFATMTTPAMLDAEGIDHIVLCHTEEQKQKFIEHGTADPKKLIATGQPKGIARNRNAALEMMDDDEWALFLVDDMKQITEPINPPELTSRNSLAMYYCTFPNPDTAGSLYS